MHENGSQKTLKALIALGKLVPVALRAIGLMEILGMIFGEFFCGIGNAIRQKLVIEKAPVSTEVTQRLLSLEKGRQRQRVVEHSGFLCS